MRPDDPSNEAPPYDNFTKALGNLREICAMREDDIVRDALLKRFALAFETALLIMRRELKCSRATIESGDVLKAARNANLIADIVTWSAIHRQREQAVQAFEASESAAIGGFIRTHALPAFEALHERITLQNKCD